MDENAIKDLFYWAGRVAIGLSTRNDGITDEALRTLNYIVATACRKRRISTVA